MIHHFQQLLEGITNDPSRPVKEIPLMSEDEQRQLLTQWNDTRTDYPRDKCIHHFFEDQVQRTPEATALIFQNKDINYLELNNRSNQLARHLQTLGVKPGVFVGVQMERSIDMIIALLGIIKAGGAYLPLDPSYPEERLSYMVKDAAIRILLTEITFGKQVLRYPKSRNRRTPGTPRLSCLHFRFHRQAQRRDRIAKRRCEPLQLDVERLSLWRGEICCQKTSQGFCRFFLGTVRPAFKGVSRRYFAHRYCERCTRLYPRSFIRQNNPSCSCPFFAA